MLRDGQKRCDGCDNLASGVTTYEVGESGAVEYCPSCETLREVRGIKLSEQQQYGLKCEGETHD